MTCCGREEAMPRKQWRWFFCDEVVRSGRAAAEHFGTEIGCDYPTPACQVKAHEGHLGAHIRQLEAELATWNNESHQIQQSIPTLEGEVAEKLRRAEEDGYARGVADMKKQGYCVEPEKHVA